VMSMETNRQYYRVVVRTRKLNGFDAYEEVEYSPVYAGSSEDAANSVVLQKKVKKEQIVTVSYENMY
jgi:hypothetical protein